MGIMSINNEICSKKVICLLKDIDNESSDSFKKLINGYKNADLHSLNNSQGEINILNLETYVESLGIDLINENVDLITDDYRFMITAFRIYHNHFSNFILFLNNEIEFQNHSDIFIQDLLSDFNGIKSEGIFKEIYVHLSSSNYKGFFEINKNNLKYFKSIDRVIHSIDYKKEIKNKIYWIDLNDNIHIDFGSKYIEHIELNIRKSTEVCEEIDISHSLLVYYLMYLFSKKDFQTVHDILNKIDQGLSIEEKKEIYHCLFNLIENFSDTILLKVQIYRFLLAVNQDWTEYIVEKIIRSIEKEEIPWNYWKYIYIQLSVVKLNKTLLRSDERYLTAKKIANKIADKVNGIIGFKPAKYKEESKDIVILIDQVLSLYHSPTNVLKVQLESLLEKSDYNFHIIIEENLIQVESEKIPTPFDFNAHNSAEEYKKIASYFDENRVKFYLAPNETLLNKTKWILNTVNEISPSIVFSLSTYSTAQNILFEYYPVVNFSFGHEYLPAKAHLYLYKNNTRSKDLAWKFKEELKIEHYIQPPIKIPRIKTYKREELNYDVDDFIIISSGNRINIEIDDELIKLMESVLENNRKIKWLLVGSSVPEYMRNNYSLQIMNNQIKHISYEPDLIALNEICDISINPKRVGGGYSVSSCLVAKVPVLMCNYPSDGLVVLGEENTCGKEYKNLISELLKCYENRRYLKELLNKQIQRLDIRKDNTELLLKYFLDTRNSFLN